jgi:ribosomal protein L16 Arg81 hydroxylase
MDKITIEQILEPVGVKNFFQNYWGKKHLIIRRNKFKDLFTFDDLSNYLNRYPHIKSLQMLNYDGKDTRWCLDKVRNGKLKLPMMNKDEVYKLWKEGKSLVIPFAEYEKKELVDICFELERYFGHGQANVYASPKAGSKSFPAHADATENFLFHTEGKVKWTIYKEYTPDKPKEVLEKFTLEAGDLLYIPSYQYHKVETVGPRILISVHFNNKKNQTLDNFKITSHKQNNRSKWYKWSPFTKVTKKINIGYPKMKSATWKKPYFNNLK